MDQQRNRRVEARRAVLIALACLALPAVDLDGAPTVYPTGVTIHDPAKAYQGYNLYVDSTRNPPRGLIVLTDMSGNLVRSWPSPIVGFEIPTLVEPLPSGNILAIFEADGATRSSVLVELDGSGGVVWRWDPPPSAWVHHDVERLGSGNTLFLMARPGLYPEIGPNPIADAVIVEVDPLGNLVWDWSTANHWPDLPLSRSERRAIRDVNTSGLAIVFHANSIDVLPPNPYAAQDPRFTAGNILTSQRETNLVFVIDRVTGEIVWSMKSTIGQHEVTMIDPSLPGAGNLLMLDNGGPRSYALSGRLFSQVLELEPPTGTTLWKYDASDSGQLTRAFFGPRSGGAQRLPNGNTLITEGTWGRAFEVTSAGTIVWEIVLGKARLYRLMRVGPTWPGIPSRPLDSSGDRDPGA